MEFCDLKKQYGLYKNEILSELERVMESAAFINGPDVSALEEELSEFTGSPHVLSCSSGTDAILLPLMAMDVKPGDEIICPAFTFIATASMISFYGATPVFVDVDPVSFNLTADTVKDKINSKTKGIIAVSLYGQPPEMDELQALADQHGLWIIEDAAQSLGAEYKGKKSCNLSDFATTSFFPAKPVGGYGDGGAIFCRDKALYKKMKMLRNHGQERRYFHKYIGINGRMDSIQAAVVRVKLRHYKEELKLRQQVAAGYADKLDGIVELPQISASCSSAWAQFTIQVDKRDSIREKLQVRGIPTAVHYPMPLPKQEAFQSLPSATESFPVSDRLAQRVLSLPMHALLEEKEQEQVVQAIVEVING